MDSFFNSSGLNANVSNPSAYQGQSASYYNGGSLFARTNIQNIELASITLPSVSAGCGGIDAFMGGFSHINSDQFVAFGKAIIANAVPFAIDLALQTWAPAIKEGRDKLQAIADQFLTTSMNSCQIAQSAVSGLGAFAGADAKRHACATLGTQNNRFADWVEAQHECGDEGTSQSTLSGNNDEAMANVIKQNLNVVWSALMKSAYLADNKEVAEFVMNITGTVVYDSEGRASYLPSMIVDNDNAIDAMLSGGDIDLYSCDDSDCLSLTLRSITLSPSQGFNEKVATTITTLYSGLQSDTGELSTAEKSFVEVSSLPILAMLIDDLQLNIAPQSSLYARVIATDIVHAYLTNMLLMVNQSIANLSDVNPEDVSRTLDAINHARTYLQGIKQENSRKLNDYLALTARLKQKRTLQNDAASDATVANLAFGH
ncbi:conjugal transfer protein TraH [Enterovibrio norvegicus]|uniref:Conjugal transfer protein TraH n=1 Tax=Enterovibrio norvegicus TaxID=188144 RepID=A0ABV4L519_9GAMM